MTHITKKLKIYVVTVKDQKGEEIKVVKNTRKPSLPKLVNGLMKERGKLDFTVDVTTEEKIYRQSLETFIENAVEVDKAGNVIEVEETKNEA